MRKLAGVLGFSLVSAIGCKAPGAGDGAAPRPGDCASRWEVVLGALEADDPTCGAFVARSSEVKADYDWWAGQFHWKKPQGTNLKIEVKFSRPLGDRQSPAGVHFRGGFFDVAGAEYYFWEGDDKVGAPPAQQHWTDWVKTKVDVSQEVTVAVRQRGADVEGYINGALVGTFKLNAVPKPGPVGVGFKTPKGRTDERVRFRDFTVTEI